MKINEQSEYNFLYPVKCLWATFALQKLFNRVYILIVVSLF